MTQLTLNMLCEGELSDKPGIYVVLDEPHALDENKLRVAFQEGRIGSVLNCGGHAYPTAQWRELVSGVQQASIAAKGIPTLYGVDAIHGATYTSGAALGPQQIALAATWDTALVRKMSEGTAQEIERVAFLGILLRYWTSDVTLVGQGFGKPLAKMSCSLATWARPWFGVFKRAP